MSPGIQQCLSSEIQGGSKATQVEVVASKDHKYLSWIGGSILASLPSFQGMWITKEYYEQSGPSIAHKMYA